MSMILPPWLIALAFVFGLLGVVWALVRAYVLPHGRREQ